MYDMRSVQHAAIRARSVFDVVRCSARATAAGRDAVYVVKGGWAFGAKAMAGTVDDGEKRRLARAVVGLTTFARA
jgi:hypothetical protein